MAKSYPPIPVVLETAGLDNLQRFGTQWRIQKIREILSDYPVSTQEAIVKRIASIK